MPRNPSDKSIFSSIAALTAAILLIVLPARPTAATELVRVTTSFDAKYASAVLHQVSRLFASGFGKAEAGRVERDINALRPDQPRTWQFTVQYQGHDEQLEIHALMDDLGMIDLDFAASADAAPAVRAAVDAYLNSHGR